MVGHATNVLPVRANVDSEATYLEHLQAAFLQMLDAFDHQTLSFGSLVRSLNLPRDPSRNPLVGVTFNFEQIAQEFQFAGLETQTLPSPKRFATLDAEFHFLKAPYGAFVECVHNTGILEGETVERWLENYETLLRSICVDPGQRIGDLSLLTAEQERELLGRAGERREIAECIHHGFERQVERSPEAIAVSSQGETLTYAELNGRANAVAERLIGMGAGP